jgi:membrane protein YqaA with SNARE-associated domain
VIRARKRRCTRAVLAGLVVMALALLLSGLDLAPDLLTTFAGIAGFSLVMYGVHLGWVIFYDRETDGPPA